MIRNIALDGKPHLLTLALLSRGRIPPRTTLLDHHDQTSSLHLPIRIFMTVFTVLKLGPWPNIHINIYSWAYHPYTRKLGNFIVYNLAKHVKHIRRLDVWLEVVPSHLHDVFVANYD